MSLEQILVVATLTLALGLMLSERVRPEVSALLITVIFGLAQFAGLGVLGPAHTPSETIQSIRGFSQPVVITLISLFLLTRCLEKSGLTNALAEMILRLGGSSETKLIGLFAATAAGLSLLINNVAVGALLLPSALHAARRTGVRSSKLLIPVSFGTMLGGAATYFTTANIIVSDLLTTAQQPQPALHILDFTPTGGLIAAAGIAFLILFGKRLLPERTPAYPQGLLRPSGRELAHAYQIDERLWRARVRPGSLLAGQTLARAAIGEKLGLAVVALLRGGRAMELSPERSLLTDDVLILIGREERVSQLGEQGLEFEHYLSTGALSELGLTLAEVVPAPRSEALGKTLKELAFRRTYGFTAVALQRRGRSYRTNVSDFTLEMGDSLLLAGGPDDLTLLRQAGELIVLEPGLSDGPVHRREAGLALALIGGAIVAAIAGAPIYLAMLTSAVLALLLKLLTPEEAVRSVEWPTIFLIAGMYTLSLAMVETGLAGRLGAAVTRVVTPFGPLGLAAGAYLISALLTQVMGSQVTALVSGPITISAAISLGANPQAIAVATAIGCSAAFLTPLSHPVNLMMMGPAGYRFGDFFRAGAWLTTLCFAMLLAGMVLFWGLGT